MTTPSDDLPGMPAVTVVRALTHAGWSITIARVDGALRVDAWRCDEASAWRYVAHDVPLAEGSTPAQVKAWADGLSCAAGAPWFDGLPRIAGRAEVVAA